MKSKKIDINNWSYKSLLIILFFLLISIVVLWKFVLPNHKVEASWWNDGWNYRKAISISNTSGSNLTDFQISLSIGTSALIASGKMQSDCDDIRITDINGNLLPYWIEENNPGCNQITDTKIWVKANSIPTSGSTIFIYYGNSSAPTAQSGDNTFDFFDDFNGTTLNTIKWINDNSANIVFSSGIATFTESTDNSNKNIYASSYNCTGAIIFESRQNVTTTTATEFGGLSIKNNNTSSTNKYKVGYSNGGYSFWYLNGSNWTQSTGSTVPTSSYSINRIVFTGTAYQGFVNGTQIQSNMANEVFTKNVPAITPGLENGVVSVDWILIRKYASTQPTATLQSEEAGGGPVAYWKFDEGSGTTVYDSNGNFNGTLSGTPLPTWQTENQCISGKCLTFQNSTISGSSNYIDLGTNINKFLIDNFTIETWINPSRLNGSDVTNYEIFSNESYQNYGINFRININGTPGSLILRTSQSGTAQTTSSSRITTANKWYHVVAVKNGSSVRIYINGKDETTSAATHTNPVLSSASTQIGRSSQSFHGFIDDVKIYPYARTAAQIKQDYNSRGSSSGSGVNMGSSNGGINLSDGLVGYWKMDEGVGTTTADSSGNSGTGTLTNTGWTNGKFGIGTSFNGTSGYIGIGKTIIPTGDFSISSWFYATDSTSYKTIVGQYASGQTGRLWFGFESSNFGYRIGSANQTISVDTNKWVFTTITRQNDQVKMYINGELKNTSTASDNIYQTNTYIGSYDSTGGFFAGTLDEVRIYNRALSPSEVTQLYEFAPGPVGYWDFEENTSTTIKDKSGNGNTGTLHNSPTWTQGKIGSALNFNGTSNYVNAGNAQSLNPSYAETISAWVKLDTIPTNQSSAYPQILGKRDVDTQRAYFFSFEKSSSKLYWELKDSAGTYYTLNSTKTNWNTNEWYYVTAIFDGSLTSNNSKIFVNGILDNQTTWNLTYVPQTSATARIGGGNYYLDGSLDEVKIYNYARTQKQIIEDMNGNRPAVSSKSMVAYWKFDEGSGTTANNSGNGGSALNGTFGTGSSAPTWTNDGKFGKALSFGGSNYVGPININSWIRNSEYITITGWYYHNADTQGAPWGIMTTTAVPDQDGFWWHIKYPGNLFYLRTEDNVHGESDGTGTPFVSSGNWYYIATVVGNNKVDVYANGKLYWSWTTNAGFSWSNINSDPVYLYLGSSYSTTSGINGMLDEVKLYNYALTPDEIKQDYNAGSALQMGQTSQTIGGTTTNLEYCIPGDTSPCTSPVAEWNFEENTGTTAKDSSGNNNNGTISGATWTTGANNKGAALNFNGSSDYVSIPDSSASLSSNFTVSFWVKPNDDSNNPRWFSLIDGSNNLQIGHMGTDEKVYFRFADSAIETITGITLNQWTFVTCKMESGTRKIFFNGIEQTTESGGITSNATYSAIGGGFPNYTTNGKIDNVKIYNYARTPAQIAYDYNKGAPVGWWKFDECQGGTAYDSSGVGNTGVIVIGSSGTQNSLGTCQIGTSAAWTNGASGKINSSLNFDGNDDYVSINDNDVLDPSQITISAWVKPSSLSNSGNFIGKGDNSGYRMRIYSDGSIGFLDRGSTNGLVTATGVCSVGNWYHIVGVGSSNGLKIYLNGKLLTQNSTAYGGPNTSSPLKIGLAMTSEYFQGQIDDVRIYNYALTPEQVKTLYNGGAVSFN